MFTTYETKLENGIYTLATNRHFTDWKLGIRPGAPTFERDLENLMEIIHKISPSKSCFLAHRLLHNTTCTVVSSDNLTRDWSKEINSCSPILIRTSEPTDSIILPKEGVWIEDSFGSFNLNSENMISLIMAADCPGVFIDSNNYIAVIHAALGVLHNKEDNSSGLINTISMLRDDLGVDIDEMRISASHSIGPDLYKYSLDESPKGIANRERHEKLIQMFGNNAAVERNGYSHMDLMEIISQQLLSQGLKEHQFYLDRSCTASKLDDEGKFLYPSNARRDVKLERFAVCRWI